jgi:hypothetical protein
MRAVSAWAIRALYFGIAFGLFSALLTHDDWTRAVEKGLIFGLFVPTADLLVRRFANRSAKPSY